MHSPWLLSCTLGTAAGIALMATAHAAALRGLVPPYAALLGGGAAAGLCLGLAQGLLLRRLGVCMSCWVLTTVLASTLAPALLLAVGTGGRIAPLAILAMAALFGSAQGFFIGALQWAAARLFLHPVAWTLRNTLGWALALPSIVAVTASAAPDAPHAAAALSGAGAGALAGALIGLATAPALPKPF